MHELYLLELIAHELRSTNILISCNVNIRDMLVIDTPRTRQEHVRGTL